MPSITKAERLRKADFSHRMDCGGASHDYGQLLWASTHVRTVHPYTLGGAEQHVSQGGCPVQQLQHSERLKFS